MTDKVRIGAKVRGRVWVRVRVRVRERVRYGRTKKGYAMGFGYMRT